MNKHMCGKVEKMYRNILSTV